jgi:two-component system response regulator YesN
MDNRKKYALQKYLYKNKKENSDEQEAMEDQEIEELLADKWDAWNCMILIEVDQAFFNKDVDPIEAEVALELRQSAVYLNLNVRQSVLLFEDPFCDYRLVAAHLYKFLKRRHQERFHLAVSKRFQGHENLRDVMLELEQWQESHYFLMEEHILTSDEEEFACLNKETLDSRMIQKITADVIRMDAKSLKKHFEWLENKYAGRTQYSAVYAKFIFASVVEKLYWDQAFATNRRLCAEISEMYSCLELSGIIAIARRNIEAYVAYLDNMEKKNRSKIENILEYMELHYEEDLDAQDLAEKFELASGYLTFLFRRVTGFNFYHFLHEIRMREALRVPLGEEEESFFGFTNRSYFERAYQQYYGKDYQNNKISS